MAQSKNYDISQVGEKVDTLETNVNQLSPRVTSVENELNDTDARVSGLENRMTPVETDVTALKNKTSNINNTSDANKPISTATQTALNGKANLTISNSFTQGNQFLSNATIGGNISGKLYFRNESNVAHAEIGLGTNSGVTDQFGFYSVNGKTFLFNANVLAPAFDAQRGITVGRAVNETKLSINNFGDGVGYGIVMRPVVANTTAILFQNNGGSPVGAIVTTSSATSYGTTSDYRLKENIKSLVNISIDIENANISQHLKDFMKVRPVSYSWISNPEQGYTQGFIAHELQEIYSFAVTGTKDDTVDIGNAIIPEVVIEKDGAPFVSEPEKTLYNVSRDEVPANAKFTITGNKIKPQTVDYSKVVGPLTASVQELTLLVIKLQKEIEELKEAQNGTK